MARPILRGAIVWAELDPVVGHEQGGSRPVVVLTRPAFNDKSETVIAMPLTSQEPRAGFPLTHPLPRGATPKPSWVKVSQVRTIGVGRLGQRIGEVSDEDLKRLCIALNLLIC